MSAFVSYFISKAKIDALDSLLSSGAGSVTDPDTALIVVNTIGSVLGPGEGDGPKTVGLEVAMKAVDATEVTGLFWIHAHLSLF